MRISPSVFLGALAGLVLSQGPPPASGQAMVVPDDVACTECSISLERTGAIGAVQDPVSLGFMDWRTVSVGADGDVLVVPMYHPGMVAFYDASGSFVGAYGRAGPGPKELQNIQAIQARPQGGAWVFQTGRVSTISPDGEVEYAAPFTISVNDVEATTGGELVVAGTLGGSATGFGKRVHLLDPDLTVSYSFDEVGSTGPGSPYDLFRVLGWSPRGGVWVGRYNTHDMTYWDGGNPAERVTRDAPWFRSWERQPDGAPFARRPHPTLTDLSEDDAGHLWALISVPGPGWEPMRTRPALGDVGAIQGRTVSIIEVISLQEGEVLAREVAPVNLKRFVAPGKAVSVEETEEGIIRLVFWEMELSRAQEMTPGAPPF